MLLSDLLDRIPGTELPAGPLPAVRGIAYDSRRVEAGDLFVAIRGERYDGSLFVPQAVERGAVAVASEGPIPATGGAVTIRVADSRRFLAEAARLIYRDPTAELRLAGITGTNGKTTTSYLIDSIFRGAGLRSCVVGTLGMKLGDRPVPTERTTPEAPDLLLFFRQALEAGCTHGVMEVSSHALALRRVFGVRLETGIFTNLTPDHLDFHGDMETYYLAKRLLFQPEGENRVETAVINTDDPYGDRLAREVQCRVIRFGFAEGADVRPEEIRSRADGTALRLRTPRGGIAIETKLIGRPNVYNILAAAGAALALDVDLDAVRAGIEGLAGVPGRMELVDAGQPFAVVVDYAHTPDALQKALETLRELPHRRLTVVFGCGGDRDRTKRPVMGRIAATMSDVAIATSDNPRSEDPAAILAEIERGLAAGPAESAVIPDRREAIRAAVRRAGAGDVVLIAGKGHETYQVIGTRVLPFDDRAVARAILLEPASGTGGTVQ